MSVRPRYSEEQVATAVLAVKANRGFVKPVADKMGLPARTLDRWTKGERRAGGEATRASLVHKAEENLLEGFMELAVAARKVALEKIGSASAYQATLIGGISYDKYLLGMGRPTSRSEQVRTRYVEGDALHSMAARVIDLPALGSGLSGGDRTPKVAGQVKMGYPLRQSAGSKGKTKKRAPRGAANKVSLSRGKRAASSSPTANSAVLTATTTVLSEPFTGAVPSRGSTPESQDVRGE